MSFFVVTMEAPLHYSQVSLMQPAITPSSSNDRTTEAEPILDPSRRWVRPKFRFLADGTRVRIGKGPNADPSIIIPIPLQSNPEADAVGLGGPKDTPASEVVRPTRPAAVGPGSGNPSAADFKAFKASLSGSRPFCSTSQGGDPKLMGASPAHTQLQLRCFANTVCRPAAAVLKQLLGHQSFAHSGLVGA
mmetsp:Transcript_21349/g.36356  ORF Transcript_21349/g.36356 Transcript_21349/m.36356 type:complete len:190 (+) Transcript_21349:284-853(+)